MNDLVSKIYSKNKDIFGMPQEYKGIKFYPLKISELEMYGLVSFLLCQPKNYIPEKQILKMSYLKFLFYIVSSTFDDSDAKLNVIEQLKVLLSHITKSDVEVLIDFNNDSFEDITINDVSIRIKVEDIIFEEYEFENIREIILEQSGIGIDFVEEFHPDLERSLIEHNKMSGNIEFADEVFALCALMNKTIFDLKEYTFYQFRMQLEKSMLLEEYRIYQPLLASGEVKLTGDAKISHYLSSSKRLGRYDSIKVNKESYMKNGDIFKI